MRVGSLVVVLLIVFSSTAASQNMDPTLVARAKEFMAALNAKEVAKIGSFYAEDAVAFNDGVAVLKGRAAIQKDFEGMLKLGLAEMSTKILDATISGNLGYVFGTFALPPAGPENRGRTGHYLEVWKRVGNQWLIAYDTFSGDPPAAPTK